jgi:hypothetical protein
MRYKPAGSTAGDPAPRHALCGVGRVFEMASPCENCPFLRDHGVRLLPERVREIAGSMLRLDGGGFFCHKTVDYAHDYGEVTADSQHCVGALLFAQKHGKETAIMRSARRLGWDPAALRGHDRVFDSVEEMLEAAGSRPVDLW